MGLKAVRRMGTGRPSFLLVGQIGEGGKLVQLPAPALGDGGGPGRGLLAEALEVAVLQAHLGPAIDRLERQLHLGDQRRRRSVEALS